MHVLFTPRAWSPHCLLLVPVARTMQGACSASLVDGLTETMGGDLIDFDRSWVADLIIHPPRAFAGPLKAAAGGPRDIDTSVG